MMVEVALACILTEVASFCLSVDAAFYLQPGSREHEAVHFSLLRTGWPGVVHPPFARGKKKVNFGNFKQ